MLIPLFRVFFPRYSIDSIYVLTIVSKKFSVMLTSPISSYCIEYADAFTTEHILLRRSTILKRISRILANAQRMFKIYTSRNAVTLQRLQPERFKNSDFGIQEKWVELSKVIVHFDFIGDHFMAQNFNHNLQLLIESRSSLRSEMHTTILCGTSIKLIIIFLLS